MLCAVAIIGAGYAAFSNTATARTYNAGNSATAGYMTITPTAGGTNVWDPISTDAIVDSFSTYVYGKGSPAVSATAYYFADTPTPLHELTALKIGTVTKTFTIENQTGDAISKLSFKVTAVVGEGGSLGTNAEFIYFLKIGDLFYDINDALKSGVSQDLTISIANGESETINAELYIGYVEDYAIPTGYVGALVAKGTGAQNVNDSDVAPADMKNVSFAFEISIPAASP